MKHLILLLTVLTVTGCINYRADGTDNDELWKPLDRTKTYFLNSDVFLMWVDSGLEPRRLALIPASTRDRGSGFHSSTKSIEEYRKDPEAASIKYYETFSYKMDIVGIVEKNTKVKPDKLKNNIGWNIWFGNHTIQTRYVRIITGEYAGKIADVEDLIWNPNRYLSEIINAEQRHKERRQKAAAPYAGRSLGGNMRLENYLKKPWELIDPLAKQGI